MEQPTEIETLRARIAELEKLLNQKSNDLTTVFRIPPALRDLLGLLVAMPTINAEIVQEKIGITSDIKVTMHRLRKELAPYKISIKSRRHAGYWLEDADKDRIKAMVTEKVSEAA
jgi:hypothetical protein